MSESLEGRACQAIVAHFAYFSQWCNEPATTLYRPDTFVLPIPVCDEHNPDKPTPTPADMTPAETQETSE
ncbi:hypothetical protein [Aeromicrobium sp. 9AM]|uniref:hypothetical protein n=1 Tax=Aeromicrobium sp. 9AM TaxID=2653126 RepID=UPI0012F1A703|nr:hypothetical protein [Aeromicrobium sp. 9AM]VXC07648.1 hypothetical protein AERO9AM_30615 [Aeromicrobium sp. 9AM]